MQDTGFCPVRMVLTMWTQRGWNQGPRHAKHASATEHNPSAPRTALPRTQQRESPARALRHLAFTSRYRRTSWKKRCGAGTFQESRVHLRDSRPLQGCCLLLPTQKPLITASPAGTILRPRHSG